MGQTLDCFGKGIEFTQSHRPEEAIADSYDKCEPGFKPALFIHCDSSAMSLTVITDRKKMLCFSAYISSPNNGEQKATD